MDFEKIGGIRKASFGPQGAKGDADGNEFGAHFEGLLDEDTAPVNLGQRVESIFKPELKHTVPSPLGFGIQVSPLFKGLSPEALSVVQGITPDQSDEDAIEALLPVINDLLN